MTAEATRRTRRIGMLTAALLAHVALVAALLAIPPEMPPPEEQEVELMALPAPPPPRTPVDEPQPTKPEQIQIPQPVRPPPLRLFQPKPFPEATASMPAIPIPAQEPPPPPPPAPPSTVAPPSTYVAKLFAHLARYKRYPRSAQAAREQGTVYLRFTMDRQGHVLSHRIERGSGFADLDAEVDSMIERAQPLPELPAEMPDRLEIVVPIQFSVR